MEKTRAPRSSPPVKVYCLPEAGTSCVTVIRSVMMPPTEAKIWRLNFRTNNDR
jgi:hypothetical protein